MARWFTLKALVETARPPIEKRRARTAEPVIDPLPVMIAKSSSVWFYCDDLGMRPPSLRSTSTLSVVR